LKLSKDNPFNKELYPNVYRGHRYALDILSGKIPSSKFIRGACARYLKDLKDPRFTFNAKKAERFLRLAQKFNHIKGEWKTPNVYYEDWQNWVFMNIIGFIDMRTGHRRFRLAHLEVPRGSGKSLLASTMALYFLALDNPKGNEISTFATQQDQARIVLDSARAMAQGNKSFLKNTGVQVMAHTLVHKNSNSVMRARSSSHGSLDGLNDVLSIIDELHAITRELFDVIISGMKKRRDSLLLCITTAGFNTDGVGHDQSQYAKKVATGETPDETFFSAVYTIDEGDDIFSEITWRKANPNYGISVDPLAFEQAALKAKVVPADLPNFKVKHLNLWISEAHAYFDKYKWDALGDPRLTLDSYVGKKCKVGIDLASKVDLTSMVFIFREDDGTYTVFDKSYIPEATVKESNNSLYLNAIAGGHLIQTAGEAIHYPYIYEQLKEASKKFRILDALYDPWAATEFAQKMVADRINAVEFGMRTANLSEPTKALDALIRQGKIRHNGSPLLSWCISNVVCREDAGGNVYPRKSHVDLKIDPAIALIMALASWIQSEVKTSVYETRGVLSF